ncbi:uncharacterized protein LOC142326816 [Lycorma delicatula]|uniref:uncharacterized protein LOC142326816 n=1 Tax=Lycorma delicatula TaxID=130591 RepID=UPI003F510EA4
MSLGCLLVTMLLFIMLSGISVMTAHIQENKSFNNKNNNASSCNKEYSCVNCTTPRICRRHFNGTLEKVVEFQCGRDAPYCDPDSGTCRKTTDNPTCDPEAPEFFCPTDGNFPNPTNCRKYYSCVKGLAYEIDCGTSYYNIKSENCKYGTFCYSISCNGKSGIKVPHPSSKSFYAYCYNSTLISFDKCPGKFELNSEKQICEPVCTEEGLQGDPSDCTGYYKCSHETSLSALTLTKLQCPKDELYDVLNSHCVPKREGLTCASGHTYNGNGKFVYKNSYMPSRV